jgi:hypothetical protein
VNLLVVILLALFEGLKSLGQAAGHSLQAIGGGIAGLARKGLGNMVKGLANNLIPDSDPDKQGQQSYASTQNTQQQGQQAQPGQTSQAAA